MSGAIVANDGPISRRRRLGGMLRFYYREAANVIARIVGQNPSILIATLHRDYVDLCGPIAFVANIVRCETR
jgi:hypothetical protein